MHFIWLAMHNLSLRDVTEKIIKMIQCYNNKIQTIYCTVINKFF